jgi:hypothetical protein
VGSALVVGDPGSGLTTFVGLLYAAQLRLGTEDADEFRFSAERETIRELESIYGELVAGRFPESDVDWETHPLSFVFGFRSGRFGGLRGRSGHRGFDTVRVRVGGISADVIAELAEHDAVLEDTTRRLLRSPVLLPLVDASRLAPPPDGPKSPRLVRFDRRLATTFGLIDRYLATAPDRRRRTLHPLFVVTKFDRCPPETVAALQMPPGSPTTWESGTREAIGARILETYFPATSLFLLRTRSSRAATLAPPLWFFSSLRLTGDAPGAGIVRRSRFPVGGWEPEYPFEEYRGLIEELARLAHRHPDLGAGE